MRLLLAEDEPDFLATLARVLRAQGYAVDEATDGVDALHKAQISDYDAIILDGMLPGMDGLEVLRELRRTRRTPVLMLTARGKTQDRVRGLDTGADDYMAKPVDLHELTARVRALIRRSAGNAGAPIVIGDVAIDLAARRVSRAGEPVALSARAGTEISVSTRTKNDSVILAVRDTAAASPPTNFRTSSSGSIAWTAPALALLAERVLVSPFAKALRRPTAARSRWKARPA